MRLHAFEGSSHALEGTCQALAEVLLQDFLSDLQLATPRQETLQV